MTKKIIISILFSLFVYQGLQSQVLLSILFGDKLNTEKLKFGLNGGFNFSNVSNLPSSKQNSNFNIGFYFDFLLKEEKSWFLHTGVQVKNVMGAKLDPYPLDNRRLDSLFQNGNVERNIKYFSVPALARYKFNEHLFVEMGPVISMRTRAIDEFTATLEDKNDLTYSNDIEDIITRFDFGFMAGIGYGIKALYGMNFGIRYYGGLTDINKTAKGASQKNSSFNVFASFPIGAGNKKKNKKKEETKQ